MANTSRTPRALCIGTRASPLAVAQAETVRAALAAAMPDAPPGELLRLTSTGDRLLGQSLATAGGKGLFTKELDDALLDGRIDCAVHSMKDVPTALPDGMVLAAMLPREDPRDVWIGRDAQDFFALPAGAMIGTASLRRQAILQHLRPDIRVGLLRGNVQTRLEKLAAGEVDGTILAMAGLKRLDLTHVATAVLAVDTMLPAIGQGAIGITARATDTDLVARLQALGCPQTYAMVSAERAFLAVLDGSCRTPIAGLAQRDGDSVHFEGLVARPDGSEIRRVTRCGSYAEAVALARDAGEAVRRDLPADFLTEPG